MRAVIDGSKCQGYANCVNAAPGIFDLDEVSNKGVVVLDTVPESMAEAAWTAEASCPVRAITIED